TRLQRGASGENEDEVRAPGAESDPEASLETGAVGEQQHDSRNTPCHAEHGEDAATAIVLQRAVGLASEFANHSYSLLLTQGLHRLQQRGLARWIKSRGDAGNRERKNGDGCRRRNDARRIESFGSGQGGENRD